MVFWSDLDSTLQATAILVGVCAAFVIPKALLALRTWRVMELKRELRIPLTPPPTPNAFSMGSIWESHDLEQGQTHVFESIDGGWHHIYSYYTGVNSPYSWLPIDHPALPHSDIVTTNEGNKECPSVRGLPLQIRRRSMRTPPSVLRSKSASKNFNIKEPTR